MGGAARIASITACLFLGWNAPISAQSPAPKPDPAADEQELKRQIEELKSQVDQLKKAKDDAAAAQAPAAAGAAQPGAAQQDPPSAKSADKGSAKSRAASGCFVEQASDERYCPGWMVEVLTASPSGETVVGQFPSEKPRIRLKDHEAHFPFHDRVIGYRGTATFIAKDAGDHTFSMRTESDTGGPVRCQAAMKVYGEPIFENTRTQSTTMVGSRSLQAGPHDVEFAYYCTYKETAMRKPERLPVPAMTLAVLTPTESKPRPFKKDELVHKAS